MPATSLLASQDLRRQAEQGLAQRQGAGIAAADGLLVGRNGRGETPGERKADECSYGHLYEL